MPNFLKTHCASATSVFFSASEHVDTIWANCSLENFASAWPICVVGLCDGMPAAPPSLREANSQRDIVSVMICTERARFAALVDRLEAIRRREFGANVCPVLCLLAEDSVGCEQALAWVFERITAQTYVLTSEYLRLDAFALSTAAKQRVEQGWDCLQVDLVRFEHGGFRFDVGDYVRYRTYARAARAAFWPPCALGSVLLAPDIARHSARTLLDAPNKSLGEAVALAELLVGHGPIVRAPILIGSREAHGAERWRGLDGAVAHAFLQRLAAAVSAPAVETCPELDLFQVYGAALLCEVTVALSTPFANVEQAAGLAGSMEFWTQLRDRVSLAVVSNEAAFDLGGVIADALQLRGLAHLELEQDEVERHIVRVLHDAILAGRFGSARDALEPLLARLAAEMARKLPEGAQAADLAWAFLELVREAKSGPPIGADAVGISRITLGRLESAMQAFCETEQAANLRVELLEAQLAEARSALGEMYPGRLLLLLNRGIRGSWRERASLPWRLTRLVGRVVFIERRGLAWLRGRAARPRT